MINAIISTLTNFRNTLDYNRKVRDTKNELSRLTNHELMDIGLTRGDIHHIAMSSYTKPEKVSANDVSVIEPNPNLKGFV